ncbi:MAG TPA: hypothetical protein VMV49_10460 [Candidatus Deferrimicrobium sp.]|nr:hypothetical protein [Candidatus Deferrimicrobium sp.]
MGSKVRQQADSLGITQQQLTTLYAQAHRYRRTASKFIPDVGDEIRDFMTLINPAIAQDKAGGGRNFTFHYLSIIANLYVEVVDKSAGLVAANPSNRAIQINIYSNNEEYIQGIAKAVNQVFENGMLANIDWKKIEKTFKVKSEDCIATWNTLLK